MADRILGLVGLILSAGMAWLARGYEAPISYEPVGPAAFPLVLALLMALLSGWMVVRPVAATQASAEPEVPGSALKVLALVAAMLVYAGLFQWLGFVLATTLMALPVGMVFGGSWRQSLVGGAGLGVSLFWLFDRVFDVTLPAGLLSILG
jgi:putative tricarboxylic transport membrane protein